MLWQVLELEPSSSWAAKMVQDLQPEVQQRQEKMKEEMMGMYHIAALPVTAGSTPVGVVMERIC
jgi:membrane protein insertase Oxa1/YidC/SpoIIIJ